MTSLYERTDDYVLHLSDEGLRRSASDNQIMSNLRRTPKLHTAGVLFGGFGIVFCLCLMFARALLGNS
jgi:hypothetical protein